ncbi:MAG: hypothetical protein ACI9UJ_001372, partial [bacterium]
MIKALLCVVLCCLAVAVYAQSTLATDTVAMESNLNEERTIRVVELKMQRLELNRQIDLL